MTVAFIPLLPLACYDLFAYRQAVTGHFKACAA